MAVTINLKEIFSADSAGDFASKINFNFNQLLALGVGQTGPKGDTGAAGPAGPIGPQGATGADGPQIYSTSTLATATIPLITNQKVGDYFINSDGIYNLSDPTPGSTTWDVIADFGDIFNQVVSSAVSAWQIGITASPSARVLVPKNTSTGLDRINAIGSPGNYVTNAPNWLDSTTVPSPPPNSQSVIFNFDVNSTRGMVNNGGAANAYGYTLGVNDQFGSGVGINTAFPYTSLLSLYSFYTSSLATTEANQFDSTTGYRHQLELGSVDNIREANITNNGPNSPVYVISPSHQNLRIRKYRIAGSSIGSTQIRAEYNLHSSDDATHPAASSSQVWTINKKTGQSAGSNTVIKLSLSNSLNESSSAANWATTSILVDGLHFNFGGIHKIALGFDPNNNISTGVKNFLIKSDASNTISNVVLDTLTLTVKGSGAGYVTLTSAGLNGVNAPLTVQNTNGSGTNGAVTVRTSPSGGDLGLYAQNVNNHVYIGSSSGAYAIRAKGNRLSSAIPFAISTGTTPPYSSADPNTLDEYQEGTFTPIINSGTVTPAPGIIQSNATAPTYQNAAGYYTKIGNLVNIFIKFEIVNWKLTTSAGGAAINNALYGTDQSMALITLGNLFPAITGEVNKVGNEQYQITVTGLPDHFPIMGAGYHHFNVSVQPALRSGFGLRAFPFNYAYGASSTLATNPWEPIAPGSLTAKLEALGTSNIVPTPYVPILKLYGHRQKYANVGATITTISGIESNVTAYDFLNKPHISTNGNNVVVTIQGSYLTTHQTFTDALNAGGGGGNANP